MIDKHQSEGPNIRKESVSEELDSLNAELHEKDAQARGRELEAELEESAKRRREGEKPVSGGIKKP